MDCALHAVVRPSPLSHRVLSVQIDVRYPAVASSSNISPLMAIMNAITNSAEDEDITDFLRHSHFVPLSTAIAVVLIGFISTLSARTFGTRCISHTFALDKLQVAYCGAHSTFSVCVCAVLHSPSGVKRRHLLSPCANLCRLGDWGAA
jgi:hypothetical protein